MATLMDTLSGGNNRTTTSGGGHSGTVGTSGFFQQPEIGKTQLPANMTTTDGRAYTRNVGSNNLVRNQLSTLLAEDGAFLNQAENKARRFAASRGLGNSDMAAAAGVSAAIEQGLPIAMADAATYNQADSQNQEVLNNNLMQEREISNRLVEAGMSRDAANSAAAEATRRAQIEAANRLQLQREALAFEGEQAGLGRQHEFDRMGYDVQLRDMFADNELSRTLTQGITMGGVNDFFDSRSDARDDFFGGRQQERQFTFDMLGMGLGVQTNMMAQAYMTGLDAFFTDPVVWDRARTSGALNFFQDPNVMPRFMDIFSGIFGDNGEG